MGPAKDKHGVRESFAKVKFLFAKNGRSAIKEFWSTTIFTQKIVRTCSQKGVKTSQTRTFSDHAIMSHMSADQNPRDFKMNGCRLKIWPLLRGTSRCPCRRGRCPVLTAPNYVTSRSNANCLHMDMGMPWVHGAVRVGHIETRLTSITLLFLFVFCLYFADFHGPIVE